MNTLYGMCTQRVFGQTDWFKLISIFHKVRVASSKRGQFWW